MRTEKESFKGYEMKYMEIVSLIDIRQINLTGFLVPHITQVAKIFFLEFQYCNRNASLQDLNLTVRFDRA